MSIVSSRPVDGSAPGVDVVSLNDVEHQVLVLLTNGASNMEIAHELLMTICELKSLLRVVRHKLGVDRRGDLVIWGYRNLLFDPQVHARLNVAVGPDRT